MKNKFFVTFLCLFLYINLGFAQFNYKQWPTFNSASTPNYIKALNLGSVDTCLKRNTVFKNINSYYVTSVFCDPHSGNPRLVAAGSRDVDYLRNDTIDRMQYRLRPNVHYRLIDTAGPMYYNSAYVAPLPMIDWGQGVLVAAPNSNDSLVFFIDFSAKDTTLHYSIINIGQPSSVPFIQEIDKHTDANFITGLFSIAMHQNGHDFWVIAHQTNSDTILAYLFTKNGYAYTVKTKIGPKLGWSINNVAGTGYHDYVYGETKCSPNSKRICLIYNKWLWRNYNLPAASPSYYQSNICLFDFDNLNGLVTHCNVDTNRSGKDNILTATTFSPNSSKLYVLSKTTINPSGLFLNEHFLQYDLDSIKNNVFPNPYVIAKDTPSLATSGGGPAAARRYWLFPVYMNIGLNGRLYVDNQHDSLRGIVNYPNLAGPACHYNATAFKMPGNYIPLTPPFSSRNIDTNHVSICVGNSVLFNNHLYNTAGIYYDTLPNYLNYDSVIINKVTMRSNSWQVIQGSACSNHGYYFNGQHLYQSGIYLDTLLNSLGCDSIAELHLAISTVPANTVSVQDSTLTASAINCSYQWYECVSNGFGDTTRSLIPGATLQSYTVPHSGSYSVNIGVDSCISSSECFSVTRLSTGLLSLNAAAIKLLTFDNAAETHWVLQAPSAVAIDHYLLINELGQTIQQQANTSLPLRIDASNLAEGIYYLTIHTKGGIQTFKLKH